MCVLPQQPHHTHNYKHVCQATPTWRAGPPSSVACQRPPGPRSPSKPQLGCGYALPLGPLGALVRFSAKVSAELGHPGVQGTPVLSVMWWGRDRTCPWQKLSTHREQESLSRSLDLPPGLGPKRALGPPLPHPGEGRAVLQNNFRGVITRVITVTRSVPSPSREHVGEGL